MVHVDRYGERRAIAEYVPWVGMTVTNTADSCVGAGDLRNRYILFAKEEGLPEEGLSRMVGTYGTIHDAMQAVPVTAIEYCIFDQMELKIVFKGFGKPASHISH